MTPRPKIDTLTADFLQTLLWVADNPDNEERPLEDSTIYHFTPELIEAASNFVHGFRAYLAEKHPDLHERCDDGGRSFGGNVYFSLSGHGCGFWDDRDHELGRGLQSALEAFSGSRYRFEELEHNLSKDEETGTIDLAFVPEALAEYRRKYFVDGVQFVS